jgi:phosphate transport system protein
MTHRAIPRGSLDRDLRIVQEDLMRLGGMLDQAIERSLQALIEGDLELARRVVEDDAQVNELRFRIEEFCLATIATQQPAAGDLRAIIAAMSIVVDLERMADHAAGIAKTVIRMDAEAPVKELIDLPRMAELCREMARQALRAYLAADVELARRVAAQDDALDGLYTQIFRELLTFMIEDPRTTSRALFLLFAAHNLERIGDRATNIAERAIFRASGQMKELNPEPLDTMDLE